LAVARNTMATRNVRKRGLSQDSKRMVLYASEEIHSSVQKAVELMGLGNDSLRRIKVDERFQICIDDLKDAISDDRKNGNNPFCIVGAAGTTNTGSIDDLSAISDLCKREKLWFHVDGAFGAWAVLDPAMKQRLKGLEQADSLALDLHKWMYMPYEIGCILVRREEFHRETFSLTPDYLAHDKDMRGISGGELSWFSDYDIQLSRSFKALKTWMCLKEHGVKRYSRLIQQNISQINYLADLIKRHSELELVAPVCLNVACFRFVVQELSEEKLNRINERIVIELQERGIAVLTGTIIKGKYALRAANTNHRSQREDFKFLVDEIIRLGKELTT
jgi:aromatic-L-amino-acid decarboxylase